MTCRFAVRERSYSDVNAIQVPLGGLRNNPSANNPSSAGSSTENCSVASSVDETELEIIQCFFPTGMVMDASIHPDDDIFQIKQIVISNATANGN